MRILREPEVIHRTGLSHSTIWRLMAKAEFPACVQLTAHSIGWRESDIDEWIESRPVGRTAVRVSRKEETPAPIAKKADALRTGRAGR